MSTLNGKKSFFFYEDSPSLIIRPNTIEHAYLLVLKENLTKAQDIFKTIDSPRAIWGMVLVSVLMGYMTKYPTYFQIRNFYELDLDFLIKNEKINYVEHMLGAMDILVTINQEVYKYAARVMYENKLYSAAFNYMNKAKSIYYNDAELHFMMAKYYIFVKDFHNAEFYINECLKLVPEYYPAKILRQKIEANWF